MTDPQMDPVQAAMAGELRLLDREVRSSARLIDELLDPEFTEIGASGRFWSRSEIIADLVENARPSDEPITVSEMTGVLLAPGLVHLTYVSDNGGRRARRSSVWRRSGDGWRVYFHQGTLSSL
ncbi:nuclear transport factor 2 family protein [Nonomuraea sp. NPDC050691]|uniref:nuclear transport factor 2 family protein n=1 Tax=Nonomuraea sp. NPDC050691 TaxID=3155661 RepID=UPI00340308C6